MEPGDPTSGPPLAVAAVLLFSRDPESLAAFYRGRLGVPLRAVRVPGLDPHWACDVGRVYVSIWPLDGSGAPGATAGAAGVAFQVRDVESDYRRLVAAGVPSVFPPRRTAVGIIARLRDPDGNAVELVQVVPGGG